MLNNNIYDNGSYILGCKKDILEDIKNNVNEDNEETYTELLEELKEYNDNDILVINYENGMGYYIVYFTPEDMKEVE